MKPWHRFKDFLDGHPVDHIPVALIGTNRFFASLESYPLIEVLHDPRLMVEVQRRAFQKFPDVLFIPGAWPDYGVGILSAFGCIIYWSKDSMPQIRAPIIKCLDDICALKLPDPFTCGLMPWYLETLKLFVDQAGVFEDQLYFLWSFGPGEIAAHLWGVSEFLLNMYKAPDDCHQLLEKVTQTIMDWLNAQRTINPRARGILLTDDIAGMISDKHYREFLFPLHKKIREAFEDYVFVFHDDTKSNHILQSVKQVGFDVFNIGKMTDLGLAIQTIGDRVKIMGNLDPIELFTKGTLEELSRVVTLCLEIEGSNTSLVLSAGGGLNEGTDPEIIDALINCVRAGHLENRNEPYFSTRKS